MGTSKLSYKSRPEKASYQVVTGSLPLKKRKLRLISIDHAQDSHAVTLDSSSRHIVNSDSRASLSTPKIALSSIVPQVSPIETCLPTLDPSSPISLAGGGNPRINGTNKKNLPRLVTPLPNGCHWQTTRHRSYCRRQPCYNGSNFCKLHYQHHKNVSKRQRSESPDQTADDTTSLPLKSTAEGAPMLPNIMHQDKRFIEAPGQVRCLATTTRGRPCAYVSVNGTKYCNLHSQYETSRPAPRRNSHTMNLAPKSSSKTPLCSLPTVSWLNQSVTISVGPLRDSTGTVEKWGNGWVSVRVPGVGLHNRRSFELFVTPPKQDDGTVPSSQGRQVTDSSSSSDEASHASSNRSIAKSPIPTLILAAKSVLPQHIVSPHSA